MDRDDRKKVYGICILMVLFILLMIFMGLRKAKNEPVQDQNADTSTANQEQSENIPEENSTESESKELPSENDEEEIEQDFELEGETYFNEDPKPAVSEAVDKKLGNIHISYNSDDAISGSGMSDGASMDMISFNDGLEDGLFGMAMSMDVFKDMDYRPENLDEAKYLISEMEQSGTGVSFEWEEAEHYYVRKVAGYDAFNKGSFISYTVIPRDPLDSNIYSFTYMMFGDPKHITTLKDSSFASMNVPLKEMVPDSTLIKDDYDEVKNELKYVNYHHSATGEAFGGLEELRNATNAYYQKVYGVSLDGTGDRDIEDLSEEEMKDLYWRYSDPIGYAQIHAAQEQAETENAENYSEQEIEITSDADENSTTNVPDAPVTHDSENIDGEIIQQGETMWFEGGD